MLDSTTPRRGVLDLAGVILSCVCLVHCTALPLLLAALPFLGVHYHADEGLHQVITALVVPVAIAALLPGYLRHRRWWILALGAVGVVLIGAGPALHESLGHSAEQAAAVAGGLSLVAAHLNNRRQHCC